MVRQEAASGPAGVCGTGVVSTCPAILQAKQPRYTLQSRRSVEGAGSTIRLSGRRPSRPQTARAQLELRGTQRRPCAQHPHGSRTRSPSGGPKQCVREEEPLFRARVLADCHSGKHARCAQMKMGPEHNRPSARGLVLGPGAPGSFVSCFQFFS